jgi:hypothetical protein
VETEESDEEEDEAVEEGDEGEDEEEEEEEEEDVPLTIRGAPPTCHPGRRKSGESKMRLNRAVPSQVQTDASKKKKKPKKAQSSQSVIVSQHKAQVREKQPEDLPDATQHVSAASGKNTYIVEIEKQLWGFNGNFVPYALASLGPAMAEGGSASAEREKLFIATAVDMGLLSSEDAIILAQLSGEDRAAFKNRLKKQKVLLQTVDQVCEDTVAFYLPSVQCFYIP